jgi:hypothetical protein
MQTKHLYKPGENSQPLTLISLINCSLGARKTRGCGHSKYLSQRFLAETTCVLFVLKYPEVEFVQYVLRHPIRNCPSFTQIRSG